VAKAAKLQLTVQAHHRVLAAKAAPVAQVAKVLAECPRGKAALVRRVLVVCLVRAVLVGSLLDQAVDQELAARVLGLELARQVKAAALELAWEARERVLELAMEAQALACLVKALALELAWAARVLDLELAWEAKVRDLALEWDPRVLVQASAAKALLAKASQQFDMTTSCF